MTRKKTCRNESTKKYLNPFEGRREEERRGFFYTGFVVQRGIVGAKSTARPLIKFITNTGSVGKNVVRDNFYYKFYLN